MSSSTLQGFHPVVRVPLVLREQSVGGTHKPYLWYLHSTFDQEVLFGGMQLDKNTIVWYVIFFMLL